MPQGAIRDLSCSTASMPMQATGAADVVMHRTTSQATQRSVSQFIVIRVVLLRKALITTTGVNALPAAHALADVAVIGRPPEQEAFMRTASAMRGGSFMMTRLASQTGRYTYIKTAKRLKYDRCWY